MPSPNTFEIKEKILSTIRAKGPSLPVHIAGEIGMSILFTSAFLSELFSEKKLNMSHMRVGSSPIYFNPGQEPQLEKFHQYLKSKEKDAYVLLKEKEFLKDYEQDPAIRVALREIRDFAIPFKKNDELIWRYFTVSEINFKEEQLQKHDFESNEVKEPEKEIQIPQKHEQPLQKQPPELNIFEKKERLKEHIRKKAKPKKKQTGKKTQKKNDKFFNQVKEYLSEKSIEILDIKSFSKNDLILKIKTNEKEQLLVAYNKKRLTEEDIIKANQKAEEANLPYILLSLGEPLKKLQNLIKAVQNLSNIEKIE